jgi:RNA polymerase-binding transcription factor DksA
MIGQDLIHLRERLLNQRREIFERIRRLESNWKKLGERDIELEEEAQKADLTSLYDQLNELEKGEIEDIDLALSKLAVGNYGFCEGCNEPISMKRLEALPATRLCRKCANRYEEKKKKLPSALEMISCKEVPVDYRDMSDNEIREAILENLRNDGRIDVEELEVFFKKGVVRLEGVVPSESEHQILMQILTDVMGFECIIDHLQVTELIWERDERAPGRAEFPLSDDVDEISDDVFESQERETPYIFPDRPPPEKE